MINYLIDDNMPSLLCLIPSVLGGDGLEVQQVPVYSSRGGRETESDGSGLPGCRLDLANVLKQHLLRPSVQNFRQGSEFGVVLALRQEGQGMGCRINYAGGQDVHGVKSRSELASPLAQDEYL